MAEDLFDSKGYEILILTDREKKTAEAEEDGVAEPVSFRLVYAGAGQEPETSEGDSVRENGNEPDAAHVFPEDPYSVRAIPLSADADASPEAVYGFRKDRKGNLWGGYWNRLQIRDPGIRRAGLRIRADVPRETAKDRMTLRIFVERKLLYEETFRKACSIDRTFDLAETVRPEREYVSASQGVSRILLSEADRICRKYGIRYYLFCGTLLGAVRHGGFVPWDDDADLAFPREDFDRFLAAAEKEWGGSGPFILAGPESFGNGRFLDYMTRMVYTPERTGSTLFGGTDGEGDSAGPQAGRLCGRTALDLFVLEDASDSRLLHFIQTQIIRGIYGLCLGHRTGKASVTEGKPLLDRLAAGTLRRIGKHISLSWLLHRYRRVCGWFRGKKGGSYFQSNGYIMCIPWRFEKEWFGEGGELRFEDRTYATPSDADACLRRQYGEYMRLPHVYDRIPAHMPDMRNRGGVR